jgi:hypothetical protein
VILGSLVLLSGLASLIYYFALAANHKMANEEYARRFIPNEQNITQKRVSNLNHSFDGLVNR